MTDGYKSDDPDTTEGRTFNVYFEVVQEAKPTNITLAHFQFSGSDIETLVQVADAHVDLFNESGHGTMLAGEETEVAYHAKPETPAFPREGRLVREYTGTSIQDAASKVAND